MAYKFKCKVCGEYIVTKFIDIGDRAKCKSCEGFTKVPKKAEVVPDSEVPVPEEATLFTETHESEGMQATTMGSLTVFKGDNLIAVYGRPNPQKPIEDKSFYEFVDGLITKGYTLLNTSFSMGRGNMATLIKPVRNNKE